MARRSKADTSERRTATVTVQLTPTERATLDERVAAAGIRCLSDFARAAMLGRRLYARDPLREPALRELFAIGNNLNQLARHANATGQIDPQELDEALTLWREVVGRLHR
jgi:hypothetical protein